MSIRSNIEAKATAVGGGNTTLGDEIQAKAVAAMKAGQGSGAWQTYMELFSTNATELARLMPTDSTLNVPTFDLARAYLVGNGVCGAATTGELLNFIDDKLDEDL